jgi:hypothetical protein
MNNTFTVCSFGKLESDNTTLLIKQTKRYEKIMKMRGLLRWIGRELCDGSNALGIINDMKMNE